MSLSLRARRALVGWIGRALSGAGVRPQEAAALDRDLALVGFRKAARSFLLRRMAEYSLREGRMTILSRCLEGRFTLACAGDDFGVGWEVLEHGTYEPNVVELYRKTLRPDMTVVDVGANIGFHALHAASLVGPHGKVLAVEPDPRNASLLRLAASQNANLPLEVIEGALSDRDQELVLSDLGNAGNSGARFTHPDRAALLPLVHGPEPRFRSVHGFRWDARYLDVPIHFVKIDVEGFEPRVVAGMEASLARHRPIVLSEFAPSNLRQVGGSEPSAYLEWFRSRGYLCAILDESSSRTVPATEDGIAARLEGRHHVDLVFTPVGAAPR